MMGLVERLNLDEALIDVSRSASIADSPIEISYQIDECFGCPLDKLKTIEANTTGGNSVVLGTKYKLRLELRETVSRFACRFDDLSLNNHGHYKINVGRAPGANNSNLECSIETLEKGDCYLCPIAILLCILFSITAIEKLYSKFWLQRSSPQGSPQPDHSRVPAANIADSQQQQLQLQSSHEIDLNAEQQQKGKSVVMDANSFEQQQTNHEDQQVKVSTFNAIVTRTRVESLDTFRGLTIAGMIFVNYGGAGYVFLEHKPWDGITLADFVFPFFIFSMGASIAISTRAQVKSGASIGVMVKRIFRRSALLMILGLCLNSKWLDDRSLHHLRLTGVLQRFSISYLVVALMYGVEMVLHKWFKAQSITRIPRLPGIICGFLELLTAMHYLAIYVYMTYYFDYNSSCPVGYTGPGGRTAGGNYANCTGGAAAWLDRTILGQDHLYQDHEVMQIFGTKVAHDPEGILGYTTSILLTLVGLQCGKLLIRHKTHKARILNLIQWLCLMALASLCAIAIPVNKRLWSLSFVTVTGAGAYLIMALLYLLVDVYECHGTFLLRLLNSAGKNAIFLYVGHSLLAGMLPWHFAVDSTSHLELLLRLSWSTFVWLLVAHYMARKRMFIKI